MTPSCSTAEVEDSGVAVGRRCRGREYGWMRGKWVDETTEERGEG